MRVGITTMGCRSNFADTTDLQLALVSAGQEPVQFGESADVCVINTCTVTDSAEREVRSLINAAKKTGSRVVITGCLATVGSEVFSELEEGDLIVPPGKRSALLKAIIRGEGTQDGDVKELKRSIRHTSEDINQPLPDSLVEPTGKLGESPLRKRFHLRVQEGCDNFCTFCIIPFTRGKVVSRSLENIREDLRKLKEKGFEEVVLTGTHLGGYGTDIGSSLVELLEQIASTRQRPHRVRLSSLDPDDVDTRLVDIVASEPAFCGHLHICLQALDDQVLKLMNRSYTLEQGVSILNYARKKISVASLGTDLITGFPGESEEIFERQLTLLEELPVTYAHVFPYSERVGTAATRLGCSVEVKERKRRGQRLRAISERKQAEFARGFVGKEVELVFETVTPKDDGMIEIRGTTREFVEAMIEVPTTEGSLYQPGKCRVVRASKFLEEREILRCEL